MHAAKKPIVVVGSINIDLVANAERIPAEGETVLGSNFQTHPGGKGANQAVAVARLGYPVAMIGRLGDDEFGAQLRQHLQGAGVNVMAIATSAGASGVAIIVVGNNGENCIVITPGANALLTSSDIDANLDLIRSAGVVLTQLEIPIATVLHLAQVCARENVPLILDPAPATELPPDLFPKVAWFTPNETEATFFTGTSERATDGAVDGSGESAPAMARTLLGRGVKGVLLKLGARGAYLAEHAGSGESLSPFQVKAIDTTAAGDAFNGAFATGLMMGLAPFDSARFAAAAAAISVTRAGAQPSMPTMEEVERMLATGNTGTRQTREKHQRPEGR